jgi:hypothetical protein
MMNSSRRGRRKGHTSERSFPLMSSIRGHRPKSPTSSGRSPGPGSLAAGGQ